MLAAAAALRNQLTTEFVMCVVVVVVLLLSVPGSMADTGVCTRTEIVSKTREVTVYKTRSEQYWEKQCRWGYNYYSGHGWQGCQKTRATGFNTQETQSYTQQVFINFCCSGYKTNNALTKCVVGQEGCTPVCEPVCDFDCLHGKCASPGHCDCEQGYSKREDTENICEPVCSRPCVHGYCGGPETCHCDVGYERDPTYKYECKPVCTTPCVNAICSSPNTCTCFASYEKVPGYPERCHPRCSQPCHNGVCTKPEVCSCFLGYNKDEKSKSCNPVCSRECINSVCSSPDECTCYDGYRANDDEYSCDPVCSRSCENAFCSAPEECTCYPGYVKDAENEIACVPVCSAQCVHSNCTEPDVCDCWPGYERTDQPTVCRPHCSQECINGFCSEPEVCSCLWGFQSDGNTSECSPSTNQPVNCAFVNQLDNHNFQDYCFDIVDNFTLSKMDYCTFLQVLVRKFSQNQNSVSSISMNCDSDVYLKKHKDHLYLDMICTVTLNDEVFYQSDEYATITEQSRDSEGVSSWSSLETTTTQLGPSDSSVNDFLSSESTDDTGSAGSSTVQYDYSPSESEESPGSSSTEEQNTEMLKTTQPTFEMHQQEFKFISDSGQTLLRQTIIREQLYNLPLVLNVSVLLLPLIRSRLFTQEYFQDANESLSAQDWCLCNTNKTWRLCSGGHTKFFLCPCTQKKLTFQRPSSSKNRLVLLTVLGLVGTMLAVLCAVYGLRRLRTGHYHTSHTNDSQVTMTNYAPPKLIQEEPSDSDSSDDAPGP